MKSFAYKLISMTLMISIASEILLPNYAFALTTGPSQPEVQAFEPVGTTEMVDLFSGDFIYNLPLMDIDGYPINMSYHSGISLEQEASWVGLGWSLNPGEVNRSVRGVPDDFNGDDISKELHITAERNFQGKLGAQFALEYLGFSAERVGLTTRADLSAYMNFNNYKGVSAGVRAGLIIGLGGSSGGNSGTLTFSPSIGVGSQSGADLDASLSLGYKKDAWTASEIGGALSVGAGMNSRVGASYLNFSAQAGKGTADGPVGVSTYRNVPIGIQNYVPVITNPMKVVSYSAQIKLGGQILGAYPDWYTRLTYTNSKFETNGTRPAYGYMYLENAPKNRTGILDFMRDKDGMYNNTMKYLPAAALGYDVYSISGQGTGGSFRPFRNDIGAVYDPFTESSTSYKSVALEFGIGGMSELGGDISLSDNYSSSGPWQIAEFRGEQDPGSLYEKLYFKQGGELTYNRPGANTAFFSGRAPLTLRTVYPANPFLNPNGGQVNLTMQTGSQNFGSGMGYSGVDEERATRANLITMLTAEQALKPQYTYDNANGQNKVQSYTSHTGTSVEPIDRKRGTLKNGRTSVIQQLQPDGRRNIYGIAALNNLSKDVTYGVSEPSQADLKTGGLIPLAGVSTPTTVAEANAPNPENLLSITSTPSFAHAYLLTEVLSPDYVDISGNGCSDDDIGGFVKFNYQRTSRDYRWRSPGYSAPGVLGAQYDPGNLSDPRDGKASVSMGSREQWYVHSIESKNQIAEFYSTPRQDGKGIYDAGLGYSNANMNNESYKLDSIRLFNKNERKLLGANAVPVKTVIFKYDYSLCPGTPNSSFQQGKLTLKALYIRYGASDKNLLNPYKFSYRQNPQYTYLKKDRWGTTDDQGSGGVPAANRSEFPYTNQTPYSLPSDTLAYDPSAYSMTRIELPSGGKIDIQYEPDDYAYVQDRRAMQMVKLEGLGSSPAFDPAVPNATLYNRDKQFDYVYFKRDLAAEFDKGSSPDLRRVYLENEDHLYYSVLTEIRSGRYEPIKGFAKVVEVGICTGSSHSADYGYIKLEKPVSSDREFNPIAMYAMNYAKWNLSQIIYPGYNASGLGEVLEALRHGLKEFANMSKPLETFVREGYCSRVDLSRSWLRLQSADLKKYGGGIRVKQLSISDEWQLMSNSPSQATGTYGKTYDYTDSTALYGVISSGVASYEPMIGGDENPLRRPAPYTAAENIALPAIELYQLEPIGESFFPGGSVGYSSMKVRSIHAPIAKSSMSEEEHLFYTAKDYPIRVQTTPLESIPRKRNGIFEQAIMEHATQGHSIYLNDMHGRPKAKNNYVITGYDGADPAAPKIRRKRISGIEYFYNEDAQGNLSNNVNAFHLMQSGGKLTYQLQQMDLGLESDVVFDSRNRFDETVSVGADVNLNIVAYPPLVAVPFPIPSLFTNYHKETTLFHSLAATKIFQQYGILKKIDVFEEDSKTTTTENLVYDAESGNVLLSRTTNEFSDNEYSQSIPSYLAYEQMGPAYLNIGLKDNPELFYVNRNYIGYMDVGNRDNYIPGDELYFKSAQQQEEKLWVTGKSMVSLQDYYGYNSPDSTLILFFSYNNVDEYEMTVHSAGAPKAKTAPPPADYWNWQHPLLHGVYVQNGVYTVNGRLLPSTTNLADPKTITAAGGTLAYYVSNSSNNDGGSNPVKKLTLDVMSLPGKCLLSVVPRYRISHATSNAGATNFWAATAPKFYEDASTEIVRSGRRNTLGLMLQTATSTKAPNLDPGAFKNAHIISQDLISVSAQSFTDTTQQYKNFIPMLAPAVVSGVMQSGQVYEGLNRYVTGQAGTSRPYQQFIRFADRNYAQGHSRVDGTFNMLTPIWNVSAPADACGPFYFLKQDNSPDVAAKWKRATTVTKYDMYGNAVEETDALGIPSTALYGFNKKLPIGVASNADQQSIFYEGFEDFSSQLIPAVTAQMFYSYNSSITQSWITTSNRVATGIFGSPFTTALFGEFGASYNTAPGTSGWYRMATTNPNQSGAIVSASAHTGRNSLSIGSSALIINVPARAKQSMPGIIEPFTVEFPKRYLVSMWVKNLANAGAPSISVPGSPTVNLAPKGQPIEGWQLMELDWTPISGFPLPSSVSLNLPANIQVDDIRVMPFAANMKSFVYDYLFNNRVSAELDANHYATFYEYDAEGRLLRVKKETERGILTISENRSSLKKNYQ